ncbi:MAG TPA: APC family permease [Thermoanaerobaculia bacterium]|nr:APC family permease [Thermoanaerobaculia bacterium]
MNENTAKLVRTIGFWGLVAMCINAVVGSGVFLLPSETYRLLGPFSLWAPLLFAVPVFILVLCFAEAASHFNEPGGAFLYARTAFGDFIGFETGWMNWLARVTSLASLSNGFVVALARLVPELGSGALRHATIVAMIVILAGIHLAGVRYGAASIYVFTFGKLLPLIGFILVALIVWRSNPLPASFDVPGAGTDWNAAALFMLFAYAGFENLGVPAGEYKNPQRHLPFALLTGILAIAAIYVLAQLGAMATIPDLSATQTAIADAAGVLIGGAGAVIVTIGALLSIAGTNSGTMLEGSRMLYALSLGRRYVGAVGYVHPRFRTPTVAIVIHAGFALVLALAGSFVQLAMLSAVARLTTYLVTCAAVPRLRKMGSVQVLGAPVAPPEPGAPPKFRLPGGPVIPILGVMVSLAVFLSLSWFNFAAAGIALAAGALLYLASRVPRGQV